MASRNQPVPGLKKKTGPPKGESFWRSMPGIMTGAAGVVAALGTLLGALDQLPFSLGWKEGNAVEQRMRVVKADDGWLALRERPTTKSPTLAKITVGRSMVCGDKQGGEHGGTWRPCTDDAGNKGFSSDLYLEEIEGS